MAKFLNSVCLSAMFILLTGCMEQKSQDGDDMQAKINQFVPTEIKYDATLLDDRQKVVVEKIYHAAKIMDDIFLGQVYAGNKAIRSRLLSENSEDARLKLEYFDIMFGPFDRLDHEKPFIGTQAKPKGANYYPEDMTREEFENWIKEHPEDEDAFTSEFTVIRRDEDKLVAIPYSEFYKEPLEKAAGLLREAADYADNASLKKYLLSRAAAFKSNDYFQSDMDWMDLKDHSIEVVIGPYEVYEDALFNYKAAFECFLTIKDPEESAKLEIFANYLNDMEKNLPIPDKHKNFDRGSESPIVVVQEVFAAGDTKAGVQTLAFNLPNDERVREAKGSKKVMLKNIHEAKFEKLLYPIATEIMDKDQLPFVTFGGFFNHTLMHEMSHGVGPGKITIDGRETEVKMELQETYSKLEECKADVLGMYNNIYMISKGVYPESITREIYATFLAGIFRSIRFGINAAHGAGNAIIFNYLFEKGSYIFDEESNRIRVDFDTVGDHVKELATKLLTIQAEGDYQGAVKLINTYATETPVIKEIRGRLAHLPVDIKPVFQIEKQFNRSN